VSRFDVAIIGAGPYGLSAAAHLRAAGVETRVFGHTMEFWERHMPLGMRLRSAYDACHISDPEHRLTLRHYEEASAEQLATPVPLARFIDYGRWFPRQIALDPDPRRVDAIDIGRQGFRIRLQGAEELHAGRVVIAAGIAPFADRPREFDGVMCPRVSHSSDLRDPGGFAGSRVIVVGAGQSAVESAALLEESGADVEVVARAPQIRWLARSSRLHQLPRALRGLLYHRTDVGPAMVSQIVARPDLFTLLPRSFQDDITWRSIRPAVSAWVLPRVGNVRFTTGRKVIEAARDGEGVRLRLDDGSMRSAQHVVLATGYRVNIAHYCFLAPALLHRISRVDGYPELGPGLESSVPGLHFLGAPAAYSFGPLLRFVSGTRYASRALTRLVTGDGPLTGGER
jgi:FAD-dependent urate hydroxylase